MQNSPCIQSDPHKQLEVCLSVPDFKSYCRANWPFSFQQNTFHLWEGSSPCHQLFILSSGQTHNDCSHCVIAMSQRKLCGETFTKLTYYLASSFALLSSSMKSYSCCQGESGKKSGKPAHRHGPQAARRLYLLGNVVRTTAMAFVHSVLIADLSIHF